MRIKKKLQIQITELEMSLDVANKQNIDLQKIIKKQSLQLTELQAAYEDVQRQLQQVVDQNTVAQRRLQTLSGELEEARVNLDSATRAKRAVEIQYEDAQTRISELSTININLQSSKVKIEQELAVVASDYEEITKELRISDERYQKVQVSWFDYILIWSSVHVLNFRLNLNILLKSCTKNKNASSRSKLSRSLWKLKLR